MSFEKRLEDARARRQIVLEQKDRAARAAKAAAKRAPAPAEPPVPKPLDAEEILRARPAGTNARALEAALRKHAEPPPSPDAAAETLRPLSEDDFAEISESSDDQEENVVPIAANVEITYSGPPKVRRSMSGIRLLFVGSAVLAGFGLGIFAGPLIVARFQEQVTPAPAVVVQHQAPRQPDAGQIATAELAALSGDAGFAGASAVRRAVPGAPATVALEPVLPFVSPAPSKASGGISGSPTLIADARPRPRAAETAQPVSGGGVVEGAVAVALLSQGPLVETDPGTQVLALLAPSDDLPDLPLKSTAPDLQSDAPKTLSPLVGDVGASADIAQPPLTKMLSPRLTGIGSLDSYRVHVQWPAALGSERLAAIEAVIRETGLPISKLNRVGYTISASHVRYYHRRDAVAAAALAERIGARARDFTSFRPTPAEGTLEVFLSNSAGPRPVATQNRSQPGVEDREFMELRDRLIEILRRGEHL